MNKFLLHKGPNGVEVYLNGHPLYKIFYIEGAVTGMCFDEPFYAEYDIKRERNGEGTLFLWECTKERPGI